MKTLKSILTIAFGAVALGASAQEDVTSKYLVNPSFEYSAEGVKYTAETAKLNNGEQIYGWTCPAFPDANYSMNITDAASDEKDHFGKSAASDGSYYFYNRHSWSNSGGLHLAQTANLPAGKYFITVDYKGAEYVKHDSQVGFEINNQIIKTQYSSSLNPGKTYFETSPWKTTGAWFTVTEPGEVKISIYQNLKCDEQKAPTRSSMVLDNVRLYQWSLDDEANLAAASADAPLDVTSLVTNPYFDNNISGWTSTTGAKNNQQNSNQFGAFTSTFYENWNASAYSGKMSQTISNIPNGMYRLKIAASDGKDADSKTSVFANEAKTPVTSKTPAFYTVECGVFNHQIEIGLTTTEATWIAMDNVALSYLGAADVQSGAAISVSPTEGLAATTFDVTAADGDVIAVAEDFDISTITLTNSLFNDVYTPLDISIEDGKAVIDFGSVKDDGTYTLVIPAEAFIIVKNENGKSVYYYNEQAETQFENTPSVDKPAASGNLLENGDFEDDYTVDNNPSADRAIYKPNAWEISQENQDVNDMTILTPTDLASNSFAGYAINDAATRGEHSFFARMRWGGQVWASSGVTGKPDVLHVNQTVYLEPGTYTLSADMLTTYANGNGQYNYIALTTDATEAVVRADYSETKKDEWKNYSLEFTVTEADEYTVGFMVRQSWQNELIVGIDNVVLSQKPYYLGAPEFSIEDESVIIKEEVSEIGITFPDAEGVSGIENPNVKINGRLYEMDGDGIYQFKENVELECGLDGTSYDISSLKKDGTYRLVISDGGIQLFDGDPEEVLTQKVQPLWENQAMYMLSFHIANAVETAAIMLEREIAVAEEIAENAIIGVNVFQFLPAKLKRFQEAIALAEQKLEYLTNQFDIYDAIEELRDAEAAFSPTMPKAADKFFIRHKASGLYMNLDEGVKVKAKTQATPIYLHKTDDGNWYIYNTENREYVGYLGTNPWSMTNSINQEFIIPVEHFNIYYIVGPNGLLGTNDVAKDNGVYGDKKVGANSEWFIEYYEVAPLANLTFDEGSFISNGICTYAKDCEANATTFSQMQPVEGWVMGVANGDARAAAQFAWGSTAWLGSAGCVPPATNYAGTTDGGALGIVGVWTGKVQYAQSTEFEAGTYTITVPVYNQSGADEFVKNCIGFVANDGTEYFATRKSYPVGEWTLEQVTFTLSQTTAGAISVGYESANKGSGAMPHLFIDYVKIAKGNPGNADSSAEDATDISSASTSATPVAVFSANGAQLKAAQKGVNIVRMSDGSVRKVLVK